MWKHEGSQHGRLTVLRPDPENRQKWICRCRCFTEKSIWYGGITSGKTSSCGCLKTEEMQKRNHRHGMSKRKSVAPVYRCWAKMKERCFNPQATGYEYYGGRGITVCQGWVDDFKVFYDYIGPRPGPGYSLERVDNDGNYEPGNVKWATRSEQMRNRRKFKVVNVRSFPGREFPTGVYVHPKAREGVYYARIVTDGKQRHLGNFPSPELAHQAYLNAREAYVRT